MKQKQDKRISRVGILFRDINIPTGTALVAISTIKTLRKLGFRVILICGKKVNKKRVANNFGVNLQVDKEIVFPIWSRRIQTYFDFLLPFIAKPFCDILINPYSSDILPHVDVTYIHYPKPLLIKEKHKNCFWNYYYKAYETLERMPSFRDHLILANSFFTANAIKRQYNINPVVLYPPVDLKTLTEKEKPIKKNLVLTISSFSPHKNLDKIPLVAKDLDAAFVVLGAFYSKNLYYRMRSLIKKYDVEDKVTLMANAPLHIKIKLLHEAKVYFHTMPYEHFGISIVEGMGAGCIPVVHDSGGPTEYVPSEWRYNNEEEAKSKIEDALLSWSPLIGEQMKNIAWRFREERFQNEFSEILKSYLLKEGRYQL
jgi:glycosyltransferase involved in cell wall biosynthesis